MERCTKVTNIDFRKESYSVIYHYYWDEESGEQFTDEEQETININQVYNQYRAKYNVPFPDQIKEIRDKYGLSQTKMAELLGFGVNMYRQYENGEIPSSSNAKLIQMADDPIKFKELVESSYNVIDDKGKQELFARIDTLIREQQSFQSNGLKDYLMSDGPTEKVSSYRGYKKPNLRRFTELVVYFAQELKPWKTQLNKLLFYADFYHYKKTGYGISGAEYFAIKMGPVPHKFHSIFEYIEDAGDIEIHSTVFPDGNCGESFHPVKGRKFDKSLFDKDEIETLQTIKESLGNKSTQEIIRISHEELGWKENIDSKGKINYDYAFSLYHIK